ncbi:hypothetical protein [Aquisphaera insulae]|uniref:hypothetical protein n=1 Tax=Aquisphaera insulae TaxID=2712864 RepID=UPI0013EB5EF8|nr:hypothetical protein [Aquisphaera insulae]
MRKLLSALACTGLLASTMAFVGCGETSSVTEEKKVSTPEGTSTVKQTTEVKETGKNPPPASTTTPTPPKS